MTVLLHGQESPRARRALRALILSLAVALAGAPAAVHAQRIPAPASSSPTGRTIAGTVHDSLGNPVANALVMVRVAVTVDSTRTDTAGTFTLRATRQGPATLMVSGDGFPVLSLRLNVGKAPLDPLELYLLGALERGPSSARTEGSVTTAAAPSAAALPEPKRRPRVLTGVVTDTAGQPLVGAMVQIVSQQRSALTTDDGRYELTAATSGPALVRVRRVGYAPVTFPTNVSGQDAVVVDVQLESLGQVLARQTVTADGARRSTKLNGFFERRKAGFGQFMTRDQFEARNPLRVTDLLNQFTGVVAAQDSRGKRRIYGRGRCEMAVFLDGMNIIVPEGSSVDDFLDIYEVDAIEVHNRASGLPPEFSGRTNACGVVAVWTKSRSSR